MIKRQEKAFKLMQDLKKERRLQGLTLQEVGVRLSDSGKPYTAQNISWIERSGTNVGVNTLVRYADILGLNVVLDKK